MKYVEPKTFLVGVTGVTEGLKDYLEYSGNNEFIETFEQAKQQGLSDGEALCSFYAKLCYKSLTLGKNQNVSKIRDVESNLIGCFNSGHGSVFEHCQLNFIITDCSRIFTHELVRHRVGTAFSQTSGRYVAIDDIDLIADPLLLEDLECRQAIEELVKKTEKTAEFLRSKLIQEGDSFAKKKKVTSAIRRIAPNGQSNEIGFSLNIRALRHTLVLRTSSHAEWEIRLVFNQIADIIENKWPLMLYGLKKVDTGDGLFAWENSI
jgi:thymidylate synthase (FAD)